MAAFGRDQLMSVWEVETQSCLHLVPTYEEMERALVLDQSIAIQVVKEGKAAKDRFCLAAGEKGQVHICLGYTPISKDVSTVQTRSQVRLWNVTQGIEVDAKKCSDRSNVTGKVHDMHVSTSGDIFTVR